MEYIHMKHALYSIFVSFEGFFFVAALVGYTILVNCLAGPGSNLNDQ